MSLAKGNETGDDSVDVEKIGQLSKEEFKEQIQQWMQHQESKLHAKLRKDLIESFSKTNLGRSLAAELQQKQGIVLSPLVLVLNTLVSEFLYSQNYHYTLCVFSSEVVFPHTLPDFSKPENFRFSLDELQEILQALGLQNSSKPLIDTIVGCYGNDTNRSLLFTFIKALVDDAKVTKQYCNKEVQVDLQIEAVDVEPPEDNASVDTDAKSLSNLSRTVEKLSKHVKSMADHFMVIEASRRSSKSHQPSPKTLAFEDQHFANLMRHVQVINQKLDKHCVNFNHLEQKINQGEPQNYKEWLRQLKDSKNGKRFMEKLQRSLTKMWNDEKQKLRDIYEAEFQSAKKTLKARYKEELRDQINAKLNVRREATEANKEMVQEVLVNKMQTYEAPGGTIEKQLEKLQEIVHEYKDDEIKKSEQMKR